MEEQEAVATPNVAQPVAEPTVTSASFFRNKREERNKTEKVELPSGVVFEMKRPDVVKLLREGQIPAEIAVSIQMAVKEQGNSKLTGQQFKDYLTMVESVVVAACVNPQIVKREVTEEDYEKGIISIDDLEMQDKEFIFAYADRGTKDLKSFRSAA